ncbi:hypothetical protein [Methanopyrus kandleri]|uniref:hypothetical protein n=1 Tax=Methanopyrus kandleri TaxID=2320 RepID=UPI0011E54A48|nr:hypothetical protein [Methanopyrus kandleri]
MPGRCEPDDVADDLDADRQYLEEVLDHHASEYRGERPADESTGIGTGTDGRGTGSHVVPPVPVIVPRRRRR